MSHSDEEKEAVAATQQADGTTTTGVVHLERRFSFLACLGMAFIMLNSWTGE